MNFNLPASIQVLERSPVVLDALLTGLDEGWTTSNEGGDTWSPYDILGHLIHGEKTDWIPRMEIILSEKPDKTFEPFDRFAQFRDSRGKSMSELLYEFKSLRVKNLQLLRAKNLGEEELNRQGIHPDFGPVSLSQLLASWVAHDLNHLGQISRVMAKQYKEEVGPWKDYMGILNQ